MRQFHLPLLSAPASLELPSPFCTATRTLMVKRQHTKVHNGGTAQYLNLCFSVKGHLNILTLLNFNCRTDFNWILPWSRYPPCFYLILFFIYCVCSGCFDFLSLPFTGVPKRQLSLITGRCWPLLFHFCLERVEIASQQEEKLGKKLLFSFIYMCCKHNKRSSAEHVA